MRLDEIRRILLALTGHQAPPDVATGLGQADWQILSDLAAQHRLEPYLHAHCGREPGAVAIPCSIRERWRAAYRTSGIRALAKRKVLLDTHALPGAFARMAGWFARHPGTDVACGHAEVIDENGTVIRRVWSEPYKRYAVATGAHVQIQPATFIRAEAYRRSGGFDPGDRGNWDGGLLTSLYLAGARIETIDDFLGCYRLHADSITMSGRPYLANRPFSLAMISGEASVSAI